MNQDEILNKIDLIQKTIQNLDFSNKLIAKQNKQILDFLEKIIVLGSLKESNSVNNISDIKLSQNKIKSIGEIINPPSFIDESSETITSVTVIQEVFYKKDDPVKLATISIYDENKQKIKTTTTSSRGSWKVSDLIPGKYEIKVDKAASGEHAAINLSYNIIVPNSSKLCKLDRYEISK